jgi:hypothetical protein
MGMAVDGIPREGEAIEIPPLMFSCSVGLIKPSNGETVSVFRRGVEFVTPMIHALLYRDGKWLDPRGDETFREVEDPDELFQVWPVYRVREPEGGVKI